MWGVSITLGVVGAFGGGGGVAGWVPGGGGAGGGDSVEHTEASFGEDEGLAIADASGGNRNLSAKSK
jgi:hypothetical protein